MSKIFNIIIASVMCVTMAACENAYEVKTEINNENETVMTETTEISRADEIFEQMSLEEKVWQMFFVTPEDIIDGIDIAVQAGDATKNAIETHPVGGIIYFGQNIESKEQITEMIANTQKYSKIPLYISVDEEGGRVARLGSKGIVTPHPSMAQVGVTGNTEKARGIGEILGRELTEIGFNVDFAPVADVITVENNDDIGDRSFGDDPKLVSDMVSAIVDGMHSENLVATLKHFPSNGSTEANTHYETGVCTRTLEEMRACEFKPFIAGIEAGADMIMVAHMAAINLNDGKDIPSTLSKAVVTDILRGELKYEGIVISDALNMGAITSVYKAEDAAIQAIDAGVNLVLMSPDAKNAAKAVIEKARTDEDFMLKIDESVLKILKHKEKWGIIN